MGKKKLQKPSKTADTYSYPELLADGSDKILDAGKRKQKLGKLAVIQRKSKSKKQGADADAVTTDKKIKKVKKPKKANPGVTQFDPNLDLTNLFSFNSNSGSNTASFSTIVHRDKPAFEPITKPVNAKPKKDKLKNTDAAQIRIDAKRKFRSTKDDDDSDPEDISKGTGLGQEFNETGTDDAQEEDSGVDLDLADTDDSKKNPTIKDDAKAKPIKTFREKNQPKPKDDELESRTIFIGNVPTQLSKDRRGLRKMFTSFGEIESVRYRGVTAAKPTTLKRVALYRNEIHPSRSNFSAYIRFANRSDAELAAQEVNGMKIHDHHLIVDLADNSLTKRDNKKAVFIGNLQLSTKEEDVWTFFEDCGAIQSVRLIRDQSSGLGKGFGYINFQNSDSVELALTKNEEILNGRALRISRAVKKLKRKKTDTEDTLFPAKMAKHDKRDIKKPKKPLRSTTSTNNEFSGDRISEIGKLKRNPKKLNRGELKKARIAKQLMGNQDKKSVSPKNSSQQPDETGSSKVSKARKAHSKQRGSAFKKQKFQPKNNKQGKVDAKATFKRYFSK